MVRSDRLENSFPEKLSTGLIVAGPNIAGHGKLFDQVAARVVMENLGPVVILRSGHASNLKTVLKQLIKGATSQSQGFEEDDLLSDQKKVWHLRFTMVSVNRTAGSQTAQL